MKFYGIADAHGLESFNPVTYDLTSETFNIDPRELSMMMLRVNANRHRHAVLYQAELTAAQGKEIDAMMEGGEYSEALLKLKEEAKTIALAKSPGAEKSWGLIPNPDLDPYS